MDFVILEKLGINKELIDSYIERIKNGDRIITVAGRFSSGKTSFINSFIDRENFLEVANAECTPIIVELLKGKKEKIVVKYSDGQEIEAECSKENIKKYTKISNDFDRNIIGISIYGEFKGINDKFHLIDTPGTDTPNELHETIANMIVQKSDIVIYVFNKTIAQSDLEKIEQIKKFTNEIIFVMTHADEKVDSGFIAMDCEKIEKLLKTAKMEITSVVKNPEIIVVSSKLSNSNSEVFDDLRACIDFLSKKNNANKVRERVKEQLNLIFEEKLKNIKESYNLEKVILEKRKKKIEQDYRNIKFKIQNEKFNIEDKNLRFRDFTNSKKREADKNLELIYSTEYQKFQNKISNIDNVTDEYLEQEIKQIAENIKFKVKKYIDDVTNAIIDGIYKTNNDILDELSKDFGDNINAKIRRPNIEEFNILKDETTEQTQRKLLNIENEKLIIKEEIQYEKCKIEDIKNRTSDILQDAKSVKSQIANKEVYVPIYDEYLEEGYGQAGKIIGSVVGNVADVALLFLPGVGILKNVDMVKDGVYASTLIAGEISKLTFQGEKSQGKIGKAANVISNIGSKLSIATYSKQIGEVVGNMIKPNKIIKKENEDNRISWEREENRLRQELGSILALRNELDQKVEESNISILDAMKKERQLEQEKLILEQEIKKHQERKLQEQEIKNKKEIKEHYKCEVKRILNEQFEIYKYAISSLIEACSKSVVTKSDKEFEEKLNTLSETIKLLENDKKSIDEALEEKFELIKEAESYSDWIEGWIK